MANFTSKTFRETYRDFYDAEDGYHKVLFNAGKALQARELNEAQTILHEELARFGRNIFREGAVVKDGGLIVDNAKEYIRTTLSSAIPENIVGQVYQNVPGIKFEVLEVIPQEGSDPATLIVKYIDTSRSSENSSSIRISAGEVIFPVGNTSTPIFVEEDGPVPATGLGTKVSISQSEYFVLGHFVHVPSSSIYLDKYSSTPTVDFGFKVEQLIITEGEDEQLYDNQGDFPNITSPGAHRYKILLTPTTRDRVADGENFVYVCRIVDGVITRDNETNDAYNVINDLLATRTKEESGDYIAKDFKAVFTDKDEDTLQLEVTAGTAYVDGYRLDFGDTFIDVEKSREVALINNGSTPATYGNYVLIDNELSYGLSPIAQFGVVDLVNDSTVIGKAFVRGIETYADQWRLSLFNIVMQTGESFRDVTEITDGTSVYVLADSPAQLYGATDNSLLFPLANTRPQSITDMNYVAQKTISNIVISGGNSIPLPNTADLSYPPIVSNGSNLITAIPVANEITGLPDGVYTVIYWDQVENPALRQKVLTETEVTGLSLQQSATAEGPLYGGEGITEWRVVQYTQSGGYITLYWEGNTITNLSFTTSVGEPQSIVIDGNKYIRGQSVSQDGYITHYQISKQPLVSSVNGLIEINHTDGLELLSVLDQEQNDLTSSFDFDGGQRDNFYDTIKLRLKQGLSLNDDRILTVKFKHFEHTAGNYFSLESYNPSDIAYSDIPKHTLTDGTTVSLADVLDFRPSMSTSGINITSINLLPRSNSIISADINYYLPRIDCLIANSVDSKGRKGIGKLQVVKGEPSFTPRKPSIPTGSLELFAFTINPYTINSSDLVTTKQSHKRFTMKDIASLEERVDDLFELTTLSLLEANTNSLTVLDEVGNQRTKAGFIADNFSSLNFCDIENPNYRASVDLNTGELRPSFREHSVRLRYGNGSNSAKKGDFALLPFTHKTLASQLMASSSMNINPFEVITQTGHMKLSPASDEWVETNRLPDLLQTVVRRTTTDNRATTRGRRIRRRVVSSTIQEFLGERVVNIEIIPFMRSRLINFSVKGLRPNTKMFPFFGTKPVSDWVRPESSFVNFSDNPVEYGSEFSNAVEHPSGSAPLVTNEKGELIGSFFLPNTSELSFRTGTQRFELLDINTFNRDAAICKSSANYTSVGTIESIQRTIRTTRLTETILERYDPLAQTFFIDQIENPNGLYLTKVKVFFESKDSVIPVQVQIRPVENGMPTTQLVPGSATFVDPANINVVPLTDTTSQEDIVNGGTEIEFEEPVYLTAGEEYAIVLLAESVKYNVYVAETYQFLIGANEEARVSKQPTLGSLFMSQNGSTWTPDQTKDLMFELYRAEFDTSATLELINSNIPRKLLDNNPISVEKDTSLVFVRHEGHGFMVNDTVYINGMTEEIGGIPLSNLLGNHIISKVSWEGYTINVGAVATSSAVGGGDSVTVSQQVMYDEFTPFIDMITPNATKVSATVNQLRGASYGLYRNDSVNNTAYGETGFTQVFINDLNVNDYPAVVRNSGVASVKFMLQLSTEDSKVSPLVDLQRVSMLALENVIDEDTAAQHITSPIVIEDSAEGLKVIFAANRPEGSSLKVFVKAATDDASLSEAEWVEIDIDNQIPSDDNPNTFREYSYTTKDGQVNPFTVFQAKVVMTAINSSKSPVLSDFRVIALAV